MSEEKEKEACEEVEETAEEVAEETTESVDVMTEEELLKEEIATLKKELAEQKDKYLRLDAEYYNYRTRSLKEKQDACDNATISTVTEILPVIDNFERAVNTPCEDENYKKGVEMILKQYLDILTKLGIEEIKAEGEPFDPNFHNAVTQVADENLGENTVAQVFQKGYIMGKKVLRHAMVAVANP